MDVHPLGFRMPIRPDTGGVQVGASSLATSVACGTDMVALDKRKVGQMCSALLTSMCGRIPLRPPLALLHLGIGT